jgi:hypothetical protein
MQDTTFSSGSLRYTRKDSLHRRRLWVLNKSPVLKKTLVLLMKRHCTCTGATILVFFEGTSILCRYTLEGDHIISSVYLLEAEEGIKLCEDDVTIEGAEATT